MDLVVLNLLTFCDPTKHPSGWTTYSPYRQINHYNTLLLFGQLVPDLFVLIAALWFFGHLRILLLPS